MKNPNYKLIVLVGEVGRPQNTILVEAKALEENGAAYYAPGEKVYEVHDVEITMDMPHYLDEYYLSPEA